MSSKKEESLYKILGTTAKISDKRIKEKYIQAVRKHPPETDPEGFEKVRYAYETLKDPEQRKQYDIYRKHGNSLNKMLENVSYELQQENYGKAEEILKKAEQINETSIDVMGSLAVIAAEKADFKTLDQYLSKIQKHSENDYEQAELYKTVVGMLGRKGYLDEGTRYAKAGIQKFPDYSNKIIIMLIDSYLSNDEGERAWNFISDEIVSPEEATEEDLHSLFAWVMLMSSLEKWSGVSKINSWFKKYITNLNQEGKETVADLIEEQFDDMYEFADFKTAGVYAKLLKMTGLDLDDELKEQMKEVNELEKVQKQINRAGRDDKLFPLIYLNLYEWFYEDFFPYENIEMGMEEIIPPEYRIMLEESKEDYAAGIVRLRKKYPILYKYFKEDWDELFEDLTKGFNREMKRSLK